MTEPDVTLTDYALAAECLLFCALAARWPAEPRSRGPWIWLFASIAAGSLLGGTVHGFFRGETSAGYAILWPATLLCLGVSSLVMFVAGARAALGGPAVRRVGWTAAAAFVAYAAVVLFVSTNFVVAIAAYLPAALFLLIVFAAAYRGRGEPALLSGVAGLLLTFVAAAVQQARVALHPVYFNHNALYHVLQGIALFLLYRGARRLAG